MTYTVTQYKQVRNLCVYSRPGDRVWLPIGQLQCAWTKCQPWSNECFMSLWLPIGWAKGPRPPPPPSHPPLFSQCEYHGPPIGVGREKNVLLLKDLQLQENSCSFLLRSKHNSCCPVTNLVIVYFDSLMELPLVGVESKFIVNFQIIFYTKSWRRGWDRNRCTWFSRLSASMRFKD